MNLPEQPERWVNVVVEATIATDVDPDADDFTKQEAVADAMEQVGMPDDAVASGRWEVVTDD